MLNIDAFAQHRGVTRRDHCSATVELHGQIVNEARINAGLIAGGFFAGCSGLVMSTSGQTAGQETNSVTTKPVATVAKAPATSNRPPTVIAQSNSVPAQVHPKPTITNQSPLRAAIVITNAPPKPTTNRAASPAISQTNGARAAPTNAAPSAPVGTPSFQATWAQAERGDALAQFKLGMMFASGTETTQDLTNAAVWLRKSAEQGNAAAQFNLAVFYSRGVGVANDLGEATKWFRKAADQNDPGAQYNLGALLLNGATGKPDPIEASRWFRAAAQRGDPQAQLALGQLHSAGYGVTNDLAEAYVWFSAALARGKTEAENLRDEVLNRLTPEEVVEARRRNALRGDCEDGYLLGLTFAKGGHEAGFGRSREMVSGLGDQRPS
jgi:TPR repeat protein